MVINVGQETALLCLHTGSGRGLRWLVKGFRLSNKPIKTNILLKSVTIILNPFLKKLFSLNPGLVFQSIPARFVSFSTRSATLCGSCHAACFTLCHVVLHGCPAVKVGKVSEATTTAMTTAICWETTCPNNVGAHKSEFVKLRGKKFSLSPAGRFSSFLLYIHSPQTSPPSSEGLSVKFKAFGHTFNIPRRKYICKDSFSLTTCSHLR